MSIGSERDLVGMRRAGRVVAEVLAATRAAVEPGVTTVELDRVAADALASRDATPAPAEVYDAPCAIFVSVNADVVHGLPRPRALAPGDVVKLDVTAAVDGYVADAAITVVVPPAARPTRASQPAPEQRSPTAWPRPARAPRCAASARPSTGACAAAASRCSES